MGLFIFVDMLNYSLRVQKVHKYIPPNKKCTFLEEFLTYREALRHWPLEVVVVVRRLLSRTMLLSIRLCHWWTL